jgi:hypothetical protein
MSLSKPTSESSSRADERRQWTRATAEWPLTVVLDDGRHEARVRDISRAGICFFIDRPIPEMTALQIEFELPVSGGMRRISGAGAVVRCDKISVAVDHYEVAVFLQEMPDPDRATIEEYVTIWKQATP